MKRAHGYSLIELMVAITLGLVLLAGVLKVFISSKQGYQVQQSSGRTQESTRFALEYFERYIRLADLWSGVKPANITVDGSVTYGSGAAGSNCKDAWVINPQDGIHGYAGASSQSGLADPPQTCVGSNYVPYSDILVVRSASPDGYTVTGSASSSGGSGSSSGSASSGLYAAVNSSSGGYWVRSQAGLKGEVFDHNTLSTATSDIPGDYDSGVLNYPFQATIFYLKNVDTGQGTTPTLYALTTPIPGNALSDQPLADGVEMLKFEYGVDTNNDLAVDEYLPASSINASSTPNWSQVITVRVSMIVRGDTLDNFTDTQTYQMTDAFCYGPGSGCTASYTSAKYQRRLVVKEIQLRNRVRQ